MNKLFAIVITLLLFSCKVQNCKDIKTGTFSTENINTGGSILIRTDSTQEEIVEDKGIHMKYDLIWVDECNYCLFNGTMLKGDDQNIEGKKTDTLYVEITKITANGYMYRSTSNFNESSMTGTVKREN